jgi:hypothetical protein
VDAYLCCDVSNQCLDTTDGLDGHQVHTNDEGGHGHVLGSNLLTRRVVDEWQLPAAVCHYTMLMIGKDLPIESLND